MDETSQRVVTRLDGPGAGAGLIFFSGTGSGARPVSTIISPGPGPESGLDQIS